jgi:polysaccharide export outer membrane protein
MVKPACLLLLFATVGCGTTLPPAPATPKADEAFSTEALPSKPGMDDDDADDVVVAGDVLSVHTVGGMGFEAGGAPAPPVTLPDLDVTVDSRGRLHLPLLGDVEVEGLTLASAEARVQRVLSRYDNYAEVALMMKDGRGHVATVTGAVDRPGPVPLVGEARFADVLAAAGGSRTATFEGQFTSMGDLDAARVVRAGKVLPIDAHRGLLGEPRHNVRILPKDVIVVPPAIVGRIAVLGDVGRPRSLQYRPGYRLLEALADAGGLTKDADSEDVRILRGGLSHPRVYVANVRDVLAGMRPDVILAPGDVVMATEHWTATLGQILDRTIPALAGVFYASAITK